MALAGVFAVVVAEALTGGGSTAVRCLDGCAGGAFVAQGLVVRRSSPRQAALAWSAAVAWFAGGALPAVLFVHRPLMVQGALAFPHGRVRSRRAVGAVAAAWLAAAVPLARSPVVGLGLATVISLVAWRQVTSSRLGQRFSARAGAVSAALLAVAIAVPAAGRLLEQDRFPSTMFYASVVTLAGLVLVAGLLPARSETDVVIELTQHDPSQMLAALRREMAGDQGAGARQTLAAAVDLLQTNVDRHADLARRVEEVRASRARLVEAAVAERKRLERRLATGVVSYLDELAEVLDRLVDASDAAVCEVATRGAVEVAQTRDDLDQLGRGLHPRSLTDRGLVDALTWLAEQSPVPTEVCVPQKRFSERVETTVWYACAEAMANVVKHSGARAARIHVSVTGSELSARVSDDGVGGAQWAPHGGLAGLFDRLGAANGRLDVVSPLGGGTQVSLRVPLS